MEKRGAACEEEAEMDSHRVMGKERRLWEIWCKGLALSNSNRLAFLPTALHPGEETGGGLKCNSSKWEEQRAKWKEDDTKRVPVLANGGFRAHALLRFCLYVFRRRDYHCQIWSLSISATPARESPAIVSYHINEGLDQDLTSQLTLSKTIVLLQTQHLHTVITYYSTSMWRDASQL